MNAMTSLIGQTVSHYRILEKIGEGGMGVVYKAQDLKLDRPVALKFLSTDLTRHPEAKQRFDHEARAASALSHPNVCTIHDIQEHDNQVFIVMDFVDGHTLHQKKDSISFKQAIDIGIQVAEGLAAAHEKGIVHRDIKPDNIMIRKDGIVQIMDFGLAKLRGSVSRLTKEGSTVGTVGYMSPEQVQGQDTDHRSDIFSFGVMLYELLTGQLPFTGVHETALAYEIVNIDPAPMSSIRSDMDPALDAIVLDCLEKDPRERTQSMAQVALDLKRFRRESSRHRASRVLAARPGGIAADSHRQEGGPAKSLGGSPRVPWIVASLFGIGMIASWILYFGRPQAEVQTVVSHILAPETAAFATQSGGTGEGQLALSPDGTMLAFVGSDSLGRTRLMVRRLSALLVRELPATDWASYPFWSHDNRFIGFFQSGKMKKIEASGGPPVTICDAPDARGGSWNQDGIIVFSPTALGPIHRVDASGGVPAAVTRLDSTRHETTHRWPHFLPDGRHFLFYSRSSFGGVEREEDALGVASLDGTVSKRLMPAKGNVEYTSGHLLYLREKTLMAQPYDASTHATSGDAFPIAESVEYDLAFNRAVFTASRNGILIYQASAPGAGFQPEWLDRKGASLGKVTEPLEYGFLGLSPDGKVIAFDVYDDKSRNRDVWLYESGRGLRTRLTFEPSADEYPVWSPDGRRIVFHSDRGGRHGLFVKSTSGAGAEEPLLESSQGVFPLDWSSDGRFIAYTALDKNTGFDLWIVPVDGDRTPRAFLQTQFAEDALQFSPDMRWIAYRSDESGSYELYVRPFPGVDRQPATDQTGKWQVSTDGISLNSWIRWNRNGKELYYLSNANKMMAAEIRASGSMIEVGAVRSLFEVKAKGQVFWDDVTPDGQKFLVHIQVSGAVGSLLTLVTNWDAELKRE